MPHPSPGGHAGTRAAGSRADKPSKRAVAALIARYDGRVPRYTSYPTAPHFHAGIGAEQYRTWIAGLDSSQPVSLYVHVPFCDRLCWYCGCHTSVVRHRAPIADYVETLVQEIDLVASAAGRRVTANALHFGGGTPNIFASEDLDRLFGALREAFDLAPDAEIAAEIDPRVLSEEWIAAAVRHGLTRASVGVQDIEPAVQEAVNRVQPFAVTQRAVEALRAAGVGSVNIDLMYGLPHQSVASVARTVEAVIGLAPDRVALFGYAHVPWMKPAQKLLPEAALPDAPARFFQQETAADLFVAAGYRRIGLDHFARPDDALAIAVETGGAHRDFQGYTTDAAAALIGFGASSISRLPGGYVQNIAATPQWRAKVLAGELPTARGVAFTEEDRLRGAVIERLMCDGRVDLDALAKHAAKDLRTDLAFDALRLAPFEADGLVVVEGCCIAVTERGKAFVRSVCAVFDRYLRPDAERHARAI